MNRIRLLAVASTLALALVAAAQQNAVPSAEGQLKFLTEKLELTGSQQLKIKPILHNLHEATLKVVKDSNLSHDERMDEMRSSHEEADRKIREVLTESQKKKLDQLEQEPHPELHGNLAAQ